MIAALVRVVLWGAVLLAGSRLTGAALRSPLRGLPHLAWDGACGLAVGMAVLLAVGSVPGAFRPPVLVAGVVLLSAGAVAVAMAVRRRDDAPAGPAAATRTSTAAWGILGAVAAVGFLWDRVPPSFYDTLVYHFAQPWLWLVQGRAAPETWSIHSWYPAGMSALYGLGFAAGGEAAANDANLLIGLVLLALVHDVAVRWWGARAGVVSMLWLLAFPIAVYSLAIPAADLAHGTFTFGAVAAWLLFERTGDTAWRRRAALLTGGALLTKYLGLVFPFAALAALAFARPGPSRTRLGALSMFALPAALLFAPWLAANTATVGNPVAPTFSGVLPVRGFAPGGDAAFREDARGGPPGFADAAALLPRLVAGDDAESRIYPTPAWGWVPLAMLPLAALAARRDRAVRTQLIVAAVAFALWFLTYRWERFLVAPTALLAVAFAGATVSLPRLRILAVAGAVLGALGLVRAVLAVAAFTGGASVFLGREEPRAWIERTQPLRALFAEIDGTLDPSRDRVLLLGEMRHHGLSVPHAAPTGFNVHPLAEALASGADAAAANAALLRAGYTHVLVDPGWVRRSAARYPSLAIFRERPGLLDAYLASLGEPARMRSGAALYRIPAP